MGQGLGQGMVTIVLSTLREPSSDCPVWCLAHGMAQTQSISVKWLNMVFLTRQFAPKGPRLSFFTSDQECPFQRKADPALKAQTQAFSIQASRKQHLTQHLNVLLSILGCL